VARTFSLFSHTHTHTHTHTHRCTLAAHTSAHLRLRRHSIKAARRGVGFYLWCPLTLLYTCAISARCRLKCESREVRGTCCGQPVTFHCNKTPPLPPPRHSFPLSRYYEEHVAAAQASGAVTDNDVDTALRRVLSQFFRVGLGEDPVPWCVRVCACVRLVITAEYEPITHFSFS
jgi:hypothetical protein